MQYYKGLDFRYKGMRRFMETIAYDEEIGAVQRVIILKESLKLQGS